MSGSVSPLPWTGSKGCIYTTIDAFMPPHKTYVEACIWKGDNAIGIDCGSGYEYGRLSCLRLDDMKEFYSDC